MFLSHASASHLATSSHSPTAHPTSTPFLPRLLPVSERRVNTRRTRAGSNPKLTDDPGRFSPPLLFSITPSNHTNLSDMFSRLIACSIVAIIHDAVLAELVAVAVGGHRSCCRLLACTASTIRIHHDPSPPPFVDPR